MWKAFKKLVEEIDFSVLFLISVFIVAGIYAVHVSPYPPRPIDSSDLNYFRDDASQMCFAYVDRPGFKMITEVDCQKVRW